MSQTSLSSRLRDATHTMHRIAETSGFMRKMLKGQLAPPAFCLLLRNLHALYAVLENELDRHASNTELASIKLTALYRTRALAQDLDHLHGNGWPDIPLAQAIEDYIDRLREISATQPLLLVAHAYVRYMGDLSGGQVLAEIVNRTFRLTEDSGMAFYRFDADPIHLKVTFREMLDELQPDPATSEAIIREANRAFEHHVRLFEELDRSTAASP